MRRRLPQSNRGQAGSPPRLGRDALQRVRDGEIEYGPGTLRPYQIRLYHRWDFSTAQSREPWVNLAE